MSAVESSTSEKINYAIENGITFAEALEIPKDAIEGGYALAYNNYKANNFKDAETLFQALSLFDMADPRFTMGLGLCREKRDEFAMAADAYTLSAIVSDFKDPVPLYHMAVCYMKLGDKHNALLALDKVALIEEDQYTKDLKNTCKELHKILSAK